MDLLFWSIPPHDTRKINRHAIMDLIRFTPGGISRVELARRMGLTRAAVSSIITELVNANLVREMENRTGPRGRHPIVLEINPESGLIAGIDLGATHVLALLADFGGRIIQEEEALLDIRQGPAYCLNQVEKLLQQLLHSSGHRLDEIQCIGIGVPGPVVAEAGWVSSPPIMPGWDGYPIRDHLSKAWNLPVVVGNDSEMGALGEWAYGAGRGENNLVYIKVGTGVGAGLLLQGQLYRGATGCAGEIGHTTMEENGPLCSCGNRGCLEALAGGRAIAIQGMNAAKHGQRTILSQIDPLERIQSSDVIAAARSGDLVAQKIISDAGVHLGTAIASLVNVVNPGMVVIGGGVSQAGDLLLEPIRAAVRNRSLAVASQSVRITTSLLGRRSSAMGAVVQAISIALHRDNEKKEVKLSINRNQPIPDIPLSS